MSRSGGKLLLVVLMAMLSSPVVSREELSDGQIRELVHQALQRYVPPAVIGKLIYGPGARCLETDVYRVELVKVGERSLRPVLVRVRLQGSCELRSGVRISIEFRGASRPVTLGSIPRRVSFHGDREYEYRIQKDGYGDWVARFNGILNRRWR